MSTADILKGICELHAYTIIHSDENPSAIVVGEDHFDEERRGKQKDVVLVTRPAYVLHEAWEDKEPLEVSQGFIEDNERAGIFVHPMMELISAAHEVGAMFGGCNLDRNAVMRRYLSAYPPAIREAFGGKPCDVMSVLIEKIAQDGDFRSKKEELMALVIQKIYFEDGYNDEIDSGLAGWLNLYGNRGLAIGIMGNGHVKSPVFQSSLKVPYFAIHMPGGPPVPGTD